MQITNIRESGSNNILMWAIANGADVYSDQQLQSIINDELFYLVTLSDVNFFELFRLCQMYREKVRIIEEKIADTPVRAELRQLFPGEFIPDPEKPDEKMPLHEVVEHCVQQFINLALQMSTDNDIIHPATVRLFFPMISRKFNVQIPIGFMDFTGSLGSTEAAAKLFNQDYPKNLNEQIIENDSNAKTVLQLAFIKGTSIIRYNQRYNQYLKMIKYAPLKATKEEDLIKFKLIGFHKYDNVGRGEIRCSLFHPNKEVFASQLKRLGSNINSPMKIDFVVQMPIQYMQMLLNSYSRDELEVNYESCMSDIVDGGLVCSDFALQAFDPESFEEDDPRVEEYKNAISAYRNRIDESNQLVLNSIPILLQSESDVDITSTFAMLPSIYTTKAVITLNMEHSAKYIGHYDPMLAKMFDEMFDIATAISSDIAKAK